MVAAVERIETPERVFNIRVANDHNYFASGILVHNCDDPHNPMQALSDTQRETAIRFFDQALSTRLNDKKKDAIVIVMQRLHDSDLSGHVLEQGGYEHLCLPGEAPERTTIVMPVSGRQIVREKGELLWPEREGPAEIASQKINLGSYAYSGQYDQNPSPPEGGIIKRGWWKFYKALPAHFDEIIQSWDMTFKGLKDCDYVTGQAWGRIGADKYLLDQVRDKLDFVATLQAFRTFSAKWPCSAKLVEDKANGPAVISTLSREIPGIIAVEPNGSKIARAYAVSPQIEAGNVYLPDPSIAPWIHDWIEEWAAFPNGKNDDQVDSGTQALDRFSEDIGFFFGRA